MAYSSLARCVKDLEETGQLVRIDQELDPVLEIAAVQRRVFAAKGPALLFTRVRGCRFPMLANLFGSRERLAFIFRHDLAAVKELFAAAAQGGRFFAHPLQALGRLSRLFWPLLHMLPRNLPPQSAPVLKESCEASDLPQLVSWPGDGGPFITLPIVYSEDPLAPGFAHANLGMYRIQMRGQDYAEDEMGLHYQIHRGLGVHHAQALACGRALPVHIYVGGPPALTLAAIMPLPEGVSELRFAGLLGGQGVAVTRLASAQLPVLAEADFCLMGHIGPVSKPEGPFGDHLGYYSKAHPFPVFYVERITHRPNAIWPFTTVGRPPQEDTVFGDFIHELTAPLLPRVFPGVAEVHAVDAAGVHPLLLALGYERYTPYEARRKPRELLTEALHLLGTSQTALAKYLLIAAHEDAPALSCRDVAGFLRHMLERSDFARDLHFLTPANTDTLDYTGQALHEGSKLIWTCAGDARRRLATELSGLPDLPQGFSKPALAMSGVLIVQGPKHTLPQAEPDPALSGLADRLGASALAETCPLVVVVDDSAFTAANLANFLWVTFTRSDPAQDTYGFRARTIAKQWQCSAPLLIDARQKAWHAPELVEDPEVARRVESLAAPGGPLAGLF
ncbi:MAG: UbiD family decarboxylase [Desulfovibrio sp.]|nr:UbiD family decarboxylase [Desulfovibrio sp.]